MYKTLLILKLKKNIFIFFILIGFSNLIYCQNFQIIDTSNSKISSNLLLSIAIDNSGNKWIGSCLSGLEVYNLTNFKIFDETNSGVKGHYIDPIYIDSKGNVWVSFFNRNSLTYGLAKYCDGIWTNVEINFTNKSNNSVRAIVEDKYGNLYFGGNNELIKFDGKNWTKIKLPAGRCFIKDISIDSNGTLAIGHDHGLFLRKNDKWISYKIKETELPSRVLSLEFDETGNLYIGYGGIDKGGFSILDINGNLTFFNKNNSKIPDNTVYDIKIDKNGNIWMATQNGLIKYKNGIITPYFFRKGNLQNVINRIAIEDNTLWITSTFGLIKFNE